MTAVPAPPALHPDAEPLAFLLGHWRGEGEGRYPTIAPFDYVEEVTFTHTGKPWLAYRQRTHSARDGRPLHAEDGFWRPIAGGRVEVVLAHPTGHVELATGRRHGCRIELTSSSVTATPTAKRIDAVTRDLQVDGETLRYELAMAAVGQPLLPHLTAELTRLDD